MYINFSFFGLLLFFHLTPTSIYYNFVYLWKLYRMNNFEWVGGISIFHFACAIITTTTKKDIPLTISFMNITVLKYSMLLYYNAKLDVYTFCLLTLLIIKYLATDFSLFFFLSFFSLFSHYEMVFICMFICMLMFVHIFVEIYNCFSKQNEDFICVHFYLSRL